MPAAKPPFPVLRRGHPLAQGLLAGWPFHEGAGTRASDLSGRDDHGTLSSTLTWSGGPSGWCVNFPASGQPSNIDCGDVPTAGLPAMTFLCWINFANVGANTQFVANQGTNSDPWGLNCTTGGDLNVILNGFGIVTSGVDIRGGWHQVGFTHNGDGRGAGVGCTIWVDGQQAAFTSASVATLDGTAAHVLLGNRAQLDQSPQGRMDAPAIWSRALSAAEVASLYADSWRMYRRRAVILKAAGGPTNLFLAGATGTFTAVAGSAGFRGREAAAAGAFAVAAGAAGARVREAGAAGAFSLPGGAADFATREAGAAGTFTATAGADGVRVRMAGAAGAFALAGGSSGITTPGHVYLAGAAGTFTATAGPAAARVREAGAAGTFAVTAGASGLRVGAFLAAGPGAFTLSGTAEGSRLRAALGAGAFALSGGAAGFRVGLPLGAGGDDGDALARGVPPQLLRRLREEREEVALLA